MDDIVAEFEVHDGNICIRTGVDVVPMDFAASIRFSGVGMPLAIHTTAYAVHIVNGMPKGVHAAFAAPDRGAAGAVRRGECAWCL